MQNIVINGTDDFNMYLMMMITEKDESDNSSKDSETCLITNEELKDKFVTMECGHKFNYIPLINELLNQKKPNHLEVTKVKKFCLKCPYCRSIQNGVLPYYPEIYEEKITQINWPPRRAYCRNKCCYKFKSGKRKGMLCNKKCVHEYCTSHEKLALKQKEKKALIEKKKNNKIKNKKLKSPTININTNLKIKIKNKKIINNKITCTAILKSGKRKGEICGCLCKTSETKNSKLCKRHIKTKKD
jgi:hypothetical protein